MDPSGYLFSPLAVFTSSLLRYANLSAKKRSKKTQINENFERRALYIEYYIVCICKWYIKKCQRQIRKQKQQQLKQQQTVGSNLGKRLPDSEKKKKKESWNSMVFCLLSHGINNKRKRIKNVAKRTVLLRIRTTDRQTVKEAGVQGGIKMVRLQYWRGAPWKFFSCLLGAGKVLGAFN